MHAILHAPFNRAHQRLDTGGQAVVKDPDREDLRAGRLLANHGSHRSAVANAVHVVRLLPAIPRNRHAPGHTLNVRMGGMHSAIDHADANSIRHALMWPHHGMT